MENPQKENGYTAIANEIVEALVRLDLTGCQFRVLLFIVRKTYGFNKKTDWIAYSKFQNSLGVGPSTIMRSLEALLARRVVLADKQVGKTVYGLNKHFSEWVLAHAQVPPKPLAPRQVTTCAQANKPLAPKQVTKDTFTKDTLQKKGGEAEKTPAQTAKDFFENLGHGIFEPWQTEISKTGWPVEVVQAELKKFWSYWTEPTASGTRQRWQLENAFELKRRLATWFSRAQRDYKQFNPTHYVA